MSGLAAGMLALAFLRLVAYLARKHLDGQAPGSSEATSVEPPCIEPPRRPDALAHVRHEADGYRKARRVIDGLPENPLEPFRPPGSDPPKS